jgi:aryl-alcohol dehydrogenase-like predicted oxidoreductase
MPTRSKSAAKWLIALWLLAAAFLGFLIPGRFLYRSFIGSDPSAFPAGAFLQPLAELVLPPAGVTRVGVLWVVGVLLALTVVGFFVGRAVSRANRRSTDPERRRVLTGAASGVGVALGSLTLGAAGTASRALLGLGNDGRGWWPVAGEIFEAQVERTAPQWKEEWKGSRVKSYRRFGRTGWQVSDIVLGTGAIQGESGEKIARLALERGVNYFDTAPDYSGSGSEQAMGRAVKGLRDQVFIATKFCTPEGHVPAGASVETYTQAIEGSLRRLGTDHVDLVHIHSCDELDRLMDPNAYEAFDRLKQQGKARFLGFSSHTPNLIQVATQAIESGRFDVMMLAYHHGIWPRLGEIISKARREQDMGVVAMKTLKGARHQGLAGFRADADAYSQAAFKWVLSNPDVSCLVVSFFELQHVDEYLYASGRGVTPKDVTILEEYDRQIRGSYCAPHCGACLSSCPAELPIADILRHRMYFEDYGWQKEGMRLYARLDKRASVCASCSAPCLGSCPVGIDIQRRMKGAHELLTLS